MSATQAPAISAIAFQISAALENYQMQVDALADPRSQRRQYDLASRGLDQVRMLKGALPQLSVPMVEVVICHVELMKALCLAGSQREARDLPSLGGLRGKHRAAVAAMRERCLRVFSRQ
jgi:hypothetical protein